MSARKNEAILDAPASIDSEQTVLGALMLDHEAIIKVCDWLREEDFYLREHQMIYRAINALHERKSPVDAVTMSEWLDANSLSEIVGGASYVLKLANATPSAANIVAYAEIVKEKSRLRAIHASAMQAAKAIMERGANSSLIATELSKQAAELIADPHVGGLSPAREGVTGWYDKLLKRYESDVKITGIETGLTDLDALTLGLQPGDLILLAGRPSMGKSIIAFQIAVHAALARKHTAVFSLEMRAEQVVQRSVSALARVPHDLLRRPKGLSEEEWHRVTQAMQDIRNADLYIDEQPSLTAAQIVARTKRENMRRKVDFVVIDHLHEFKLAGRDEVKELAESVGEIRKLAKDLHVPVLLLAQLNRLATGRTDHKPRLSDIRGSGGIEEKCDVIFLIHREDHYDKNTHFHGVVELIPAKGRDLCVDDEIHLRNVYSQMRVESWIGDLPSKKEKKGSHSRSIPSSTQAIPFAERAEH